MEPRNPKGEAVRDTKMRYYGEDGKVLPDLFSTKAESAGKDLASQKSFKTKGKGEIELSASQLRRFFDDVKAIQRYLDQYHGSEKEAAFRTKLPEIMMLKAKVTYARGRDTVTDAFKEFIGSNLSAIETVKDFEVFAKYFEAVYGFFYYHTPKKS